MTGPAERHATIKDRTWHPNGFRRAFSVAECFTDTIACAVMLGADAPVCLTVERGADRQVYRMDRRGAGDLGHLLFDSGCLALKDPEARAEALGRTVAILGAGLWVDFGPADHPLRLALIALTGSHHITLRLAPEEALVLGLHLIRAMWREPESDAEAA